MIDTDAKTEGNYFSKLPPVESICKRTLHQTSPTKITNQHDHLQFFSQSNPRNTTNYKCLKETALIPGLDTEFHNRTVK